jgi:transcriptional regulator GlxA family with amidase domain
MTKQKKQVAYIVYPGINLLDLTGIFSAMQGLTSADYAGFTIAEHQQPLDSDTVLSVIPEKTFDEAPHPEWLVVIGGGVATLKALGNNALRDYVLQAAGSAEKVIGVSTGALLLAGLGLLDGRKATTHWTYINLLPRFGAVSVQQRWIEDGKFITCSGGTAGYELGLLLLARYTNEALARRHQIRYEYDPEPPFGEIDRGTTDQIALTSILSNHQDELKAALQSRPELYHVLYATEATEIRQQLTRKAEG